MSFDLGALSDALAAGPVIRVVLAETRGSTPRGPGTAMLVTEHGQQGTIGGGALEFEATRRARAMLAAQTPWEVWSLPLGPSLGQCCGGAVTVLAERFTEAPQAFPRARPVTDRGSIMPSVVRKALSEVTQPQMIAGWFIEPLATAEQPVWVWGAGHVGRALVALLAPMPELSVTWIDDAPSRFPDTVPPGIRVLPAPDMPKAMALAPQTAQHLILTYSHDIDLALCHAALEHGFDRCGLIGSATKWARFKSRLTALGATEADLSQITCPIGDPSLGKAPQAIAIGVAADILASRRAQTRLQSKVRTA